LARVRITGVNIILTKLSGIPSRAHTYEHSQSQIQTGCPKLAWGREATINFLVTKISRISCIAIAGERTVSINTFFCPIHKARRKMTIINNVITKFTSEIWVTVAESEVH
jgi:hypothetical protein